MKGKSFTIKVSDLLNHLGHDSIVFSEKKTDLLPSLTAEGMRGVLHFHSVDGESVLVKLEDCEAEIQDVCDTCGRAFLRSVHVDVYSAKFTLRAQELDESTDEVLFLIDVKNETIDVEELLYQAIMLQEPFVKRCASCEKNLIEQETSDEISDDSADFGGTAEIRGL